MNGTVYSIHNGTHRYVGSTTQPIHRRISGHVKGDNPCSSKIIIESGTYEVEVLESGKFKTLDDLRWCERRYIEQFGIKNLVNKVIPILTKDEHHANKVVYTAEHREEKAAYDVKYAAEHRKQKAAYKAEYNNNHRDELAKYRAEHRDALAAQQAQQAERSAQIVLCPCGKSGRYGDRSRHLKTKFHLGWFAKNSTAPSFSNVTLVSDKPFVPSNFVLSNVLAS